MKRQDYIFIFVIVILVLVTHVNWMRIDVMTFSWDFPYWFDGIIKTFFPYGLGTWTTYTNFGYYNIQPYFNGFISLWGLIGDYDLALRLTVLFPILLLQIVGSILLFRKIFHEKHITSPIFIGALYFIFNTYFLYTSYSHLFILFSASLAPLLVYTYINYLEAQTVRTAILFSIVYTLSCIYEVRITILNSLILIFFSFYYLELFIRFLKNYKQLFLLVSLLLLLNLFWIITLFSGGFSGEANQVIFRGVFGNKFTDILYGITGYKPYWDIFGDSKDFTNREIPAFVFLYTMVLLVPVFLRKKKKIFLLAIFFVLLGSFLLKQDALPFAGSYTWLYKNMPLFSIFREASKFSIFSVFGYSIGFIVALYTLKEVLTKKLYTSIAIVLAIIILLPAAPLFFQQEIYSYAPRIYHNDYKELNNKILASNSYFKTLSVPTKSKLLFYSSQYPSVLFSSTEIYSVFGAIPQEDVYETFVSKANRFFSYKNFENFITLGGIRYIILNYEDLENQDNTFFWYGRRQQFKAMLDENLSYLEKSKIGGIEIYENKKYLGPIFLSSGFIQNLDYNGFTSSVKIDNFFEQVGYNFVIKNLNESIFIHFSQKNDPDWFLSLDYKKEGFGKPPCNGVGLKLTSLKFLNSWILSKKDIIDYVGACYHDSLIKEGYPRKLPDNKKDYKYYIENQDGSINIPMNIYFRPQLYLFRGIIVSSGLFLLLVLYLAFSFIIDYLKNRLIKK